MPVEWLPSGPIAGLSTTETQVVVTALIAVGLASIYLGVGRGVRWVVQTAGTVLRRSTDSAVVISITDIDWPFPTAGVIWLLRVGATGVSAWTLLVVWGYQDVADQLLATAVTTGPIVLRSLLTIAILIGGWASTRVLRERLYAYTEQVDHINKHQEGVAYRILQVSVLIGAGLVALSLWSVDLQGLLVGAGFLGIIIGMAARQTLGSLIAGFVLMFSRPFEIGDWVRIGDDEGIVTDITIVNTRVRSFDDETVVIPNDVVANSTVHNLTESDRLRLAINVGVSYDTDLDRARELILDATAELDATESIPKPTAVLKSFGDSAVIFEVRFWIEPATATKRWKAQTAVIQSIKQTFEQQGITIPLPQRTLSGSVDRPTVMSDSTPHESPPQPED